jgi:hypothetical protein
VTTQRDDFGNVRIAQAFLQHALADQSIGAGNQYAHGFGLWREK